MPVGDDIRCTGGELNDQKNITGDLAIVGGKVTVNKGVVFGYGLLVSVGDITVYGFVKNKTAPYATIKILKILNDKQFKCF